MLSTTKSSLNNQPLIGVLRWDSNQLESIMDFPNHFMKKGTFKFPILFEKVTGANHDTVVINPSREVLANMIKVINQMELKGIKAVTTTCGFNAIFQDELSSKTNIPVFTSSLMQIPFISTMIFPKKVGVLTANKHALTKVHLQKSGVLDSSSVVIVGMQDSPVFYGMLESNEPLEFSTLEKEVTDAVSKLLATEDIGSILLECTDLSPFADTIRSITNLPVFDIVTMTNWVYNSITNY